MPEPLITFEDIKAAAARIAPHIRHTPLLAATAAKEPPTSAALWLKLECMQVSGSFKARGATNKLLATPEEDLARGVVTASGGNHGLAVAGAALSVGVPATIFVPTTAAASKVEKIKGLGATVEIVGAIWNETNVYALEFAASHGAAYFHPFADPLVVAGQGTLALEILEDNSDLDTVLIAIGGGGLISGMAVALKALKPSIRIIGIEPVGSPTFEASMKAGRVVKLGNVSTRVATMACAETDPAVFELSRGAIEEIVLLEDNEMLDAATWLWLEFGIAADLSGAAAVAALRSGRFTVAPESQVCGLVCGSGPDAILV
jgi:threonine dehydratase